MDTFSRRGILRTGAGAALAAGGTALLAGPATADSTVTPRLRNLDERGWRELQSAVSGPVFRQETANYWALSLPTNHRYAQITPAGVFCPETASDVAQAVRWASRNQLPVTPRCGGHSYAGFSTTTGLLVHLARMRKVQVDPVAQTLTVQAGARNSDIHAALQNTDLLVPGGRCPDVGVSGLVLGGGIGFGARAYGLTCDNLISTTVATADGRLVTCDQNADADLFWACRGGAGGNFGINTSYTFRLHRVPGVTVYDFTWNRKDAATVLKSFSDLTAQAQHSTTLAAQYGIHTGADPEVYGQGIYYGRRADLEAILRPLLAAAPPATRFIEERRIWPALSYFDATSSGNPYGTKSIVSPRRLTDGLISRLLSHIDGFKAPSADSSASVSFFAMGGVDAIPAPGATAYVHRNAHFIMSLTAYWADTDRADVRDANLAWLGGLYQDMATDLGTSAYQNFPDGELKQWWTAYYGANYDRLVRVKAEYDPEHLFRYPQAVRADPE